MRCGLVCVAKGGGPGTQMTFQMRVRAVMDGKMAPESEEAQSVRTEYRRGALRVGAVQVEVESNV